MIPVDRPQSRRPAQLRLALPNESIRLRHRGSAVIGWRVFPDGISIEAGPSADAARVRVEVRVGREASLWLGARVGTDAALKLISPPRLHWGMRQRPALYDMTDVFSALKTEVRLCLGPLDPPASRPDTDECATGRDAYMACDATLAELSKRLFALCDKRARRAARRFAPTSRFGVYRLLVDDASGRIAQLAVACPGALLFALGMQKCGDARSEEAADTLLAGVVAGRRLNALLHEALLTWVGAAGRFAAMTRDAASEAWRWVAEASGRELQKLLDDQRLLVRRAGPRVCHEHVLSPPPLAYTPEDIPPSPRANARWFATMKSRVELLGRAPSGPAQLALVRLLSRNASRFEGGFPVPPHRLLEFVAARARCFARSTSLERALNEYESWQQEEAFAHRGEYLEALLRSLRDIVKVDSDKLMSLPLPPPHLPGCTLDAISVVPLRTGGELIDDSVRMRNGFAGNLPSVLRGELSIYSAVVRGEWLTVEVGPRLYGGCYLGFVRGMRCRLPTAKEREAIGEWFEWAEAETAASRR